jgi:hypothetical protein
MNTTRDRDIGRTGDDSSRDDEGRGMIDVVVDEDETRPPPPTPPPPHPPIDLPEEEDVVVERANASHPNPAISHRQTNADTNCHGVNENENATNDDTMTGCDLVEVELDSHGDDDDDDEDEGDGEEEKEEKDGATLTTDESPAPVSTTTRKIRVVDRDSFRNERVDASRRATTRPNDDVRIRPMAMDDDDDDDDDVPLLLPPPPSTRTNDDGATIGHVVVVDPNDPAVVPPNDDDDDGAPSTAPRRRGRSLALRHPLLDRVARLPWDNIIFAAAVSCDAIFNCKYSARQVEDEVREEVVLRHRGRYVANAAEEEGRGEDVVDSGSVEVGDAGGDGIFVLADGGV